MSYLLDTHTLVWWLLADPQLSPAAKAQIASRIQDRLVSVVTAFEIATKVRIGKWNAAAGIVGQFSQICHANDFKVLPLTLEHTLLAGRLPGEHRDPFDRLLAAQALHENVKFVTRDPAFAGFGVRTLW